MSATPAMPAPLLRVSDVTVRFGGLTAIDSVSFDVRPGELLGLIGPNGAGKTTALKSILGLTPFDGQLSVLGRDPAGSR